MLEISVRLKYPEKFLNNLGKLGLVAIYLTKSKYPVGKKAGRLETKIFRKIFFILSMIFSLTYLFLDWVLDKIFKKTKIIK